MANLRSEIVYPLDFLHYGKLLPKDSAASDFRELSATVALRDRSDQLMRKLIVPEERRWTSEQYKASVVYGSQGGFSAVLIPENEKSSLFALVQARNEDEAGIALRGGRFTQIKFISLNNKDIATMFRYGLVPYTDFLLLCRNEQNNEVEYGLPRFLVPNSLSQKPRQMKILSAGTPVTAGDEQIRRSLLFPWQHTDLTSTLIRIWVMLRSNKRVVVRYPANLPLLDRLQVCEGLQHLLVAQQKQRVVTFALDPVTDEPVDVLWVSEAELGFNRPPGMEYIDYGDQGRAVDVEEEKKARELLECVFERQSSWNDAYSYWLDSLTDLQRGIGLDEFYLRCHKGELYPQQIVEAASLDLSEKLYVELLRDPYEWLSPTERQAARQGNFRKRLIDLGFQTVTATSRPNRDRTYPEVSWRTVVADCYASGKVNRLGRWWYESARPVISVVQLRDAALTFETPLVDEWQEPDVAWVIELLEASPQNTLIFTDGNSLLREIILHWAYTPIFARLLAETLTRPALADNIIKQASDVSSRRSDVLLLFTDYLLSQAKNPYRRLYDARRAILNDTRRLDRDQTAALFRLSEPLYDGSTAQFPLLTSQIYQSALGLGKQDDSIAQVLCYKEIPYLLIKESAPSNDYAQDFSELFALIRRNFKPGLDLSATLAQVVVNYENVRKWLFPAAFLVLLENGGYPLSVVDVETYLKLPPDASLLERLVDGISNLSDQFSVSMLVQIAVTSQQKGISVDKLAPFIHYSINTLHSVKDVVDFARLIAKQIATSLDHPISLPATLVEHERASAITFTESFGDTNLIRACLRAALDAGHPLHQGDRLAVVRTFAAGADVLDVLNQAPEGSKDRSELVGAVRRNPNAEQIIDYLLNATADPLRAQIKQLYRPEPHPAEQASEGGQYNFTNPLPASTSTFPEAKPVHSQPRRSSTNQPPAEWLDPLPKADVSTPTPVSKRERRSLVQHIADEWRDLPGYARILLGLGIIIAVIVIIARYLFYSGLLDEFLRQFGLGSGGSTSSLDFLYLIGFSTVFVGFSSKR